MQMQLREARQSVVGQARRVWRRASLRARDTFPLPVWQAVAEIGLREQQAELCEEADSEKERASDSKA